MEKVSIADDLFDGRWRLDVVAFLVALALLDAQVTVTRLLAYQFFYHFVFLAISLAQLGLAGAGAWVYASGTKAWKRRHLVGWSLGGAVVPILLLFVYAFYAPDRTISHAKVIGSEGYPYLGAISLLLVLFNFCGGMVLTILFTTFKERIGRLYASDLTGAALGCLFSLALMATLGPIQAFVASGAALALAAVAIPPTPDPDATTAKRRLGRALGWVPTLAVLGIVAWAFANAQFFDPVHHNPAVARRIIRSEWNHLGRIDAREPSSYVIDGDAATQTYGWGRTPPAPEYLVAPRRPRVGVIGVGAGSQLRDALRHDASSVVAIDINTIILDWAQGIDSDANGGIFHDPRVKVVAGEGRHAIRSADDDFDVIVMHAIDTWTASSQGAYSLTENFLYTSEAFQDYLSRLDEGGVMSVRRWLFWPPRENLRLFTTMLEALEARGVNEPELHLVVLSPELRFERKELKTWGYVLVSNSPFDAERLATLDAFVESARWAYLYKPGASIPTPFTEYATTDDREAFLASYPYVVAPATDANPFFFQFSPPWQAWVDPLSGAIYGRSSEVLFICLAMCFVLTIIILGAPLFIRRRDLRGDRQLGSALLYFACLGLGFMAIELPTIQIMTLFLGHPTYALGVVLLGLLAAAGAGSVLMGRIPVAKGRAALATVVGLALATALLLLPAVHALIGLPDWARFAVTLLFLAVLGVPLGMPFVGGVRLLAQDRPHLVAWAWAVNGATAVVGTCLLMISMVYYGSTVTLLVGVGCYLGALAIRPRLISSDRGREPIVERP